MPTAISGDTGIDKVQDGAIGTADLANGAVTPAKLSQPMTLGTAQNTTSGTAIDFTGIPSWVKRITVMLNGVSTNGVSGALIQLGSGSIDGAGYTSGTSTVANSAVGSLVTSTSGFVAASALVAAQTLNGAVVLTNVSGNIWVAHGTTYSSATGTHSIGGNKTLSGTLDRLRLTTVNGTDTFDAGSVNIMYE